MTSLPSDGTSEDMVTVILAVKQKTNINSACTLLAS